MDRMQLLPPLRGVLGGVVVAVGEISTNTTPLLQSLSIGEGSHTVTRTDMPQNIAGNMASTCWAAQPPGAALLLLRVRRRQVGWEGDSFRHHESRQSFIYPRMFPHMKDSQSSSSPVIQH
jgi:hypothetical protein